MIKLTSQTRIFLSVAPVDFRKGLDGFIGKAQALCQSKALTRSGAMFVFTNRARTLIRVLSYDGSGFWLATKRLSRGRFATWPTGKTQLSTTEAAALNRILHASTAEVNDSTKEKDRKRGLK